MRFVVLFLIAVVVACGGDAPPQSRPTQTARVDFQQWSLPDRLREISGLALTADERLLAVTDEIAVVYEIDYVDGGLVKAFAFGDPPLREDFEGIAVRDGTVWLMTSNGLLIAGPEGGDGETVGFETYDTGLRETCELEGLATDAAGGSLVLICKDERADKDLEMFTWNPESGDRDRFELPEKTIEDAADEREINPSGITVVPASGNYYVIAARQHLVFELTPDGRFVDVIMQLGRDRHRQAEGVALTTDGRLLIADEAGQGAARLAVYRMQDGE